MSSNDLDAASPNHALGGEAVLAVSSDTQLNAPSLAHASRPPTDPSLDVQGAANGLVAKSVQVSAGKRRKVIPEAAARSNTPRQTRFGAAKPPAINNNKKKTPKNQSVEGIKN